MSNFWKADKIYRDYARLTAIQKRRAEKRGDRKAAISLLQDFVNHADVLERANIPHYQRITIRFVVRAVREILEGKNPKAALCLDSEGRPKVPEHRDLFIALRVGHAYKRLLVRAKTEDGSPAEWAIRAVAEEIRKQQEARTGKKGKLQRAMVREAVKRYGGIKRAVEMVADFGYQPEVRKQMRRELAELKKTFKPRGKQTR